MKICLITTGQPSSNPRLVKEADALTAAGHHVHVVAAYFADWATEADARLLETRDWHMTFVDWRRGVAPALFHGSRLRHWMARSLVRPSWASGRLANAALSRVGPELARAAARVEADLYIAHNLGALPVAHAVARARGAAVGFDAEDFHSGQLSASADAHLLALTRAVERRFLPQCDYVTAAAPTIAEAYRDLCGIPLPTTVLNVFPLRDCPPAFRTDRAAGPLRLYWFSQTIGPDRGLEDVVRAMGLVPQAETELHLRGAWQAGYEARLRGLASEVGLDASRVVGHGNAAPDEMVRLASVFDVGLAVEPGCTVNNSILISNKIFTYVLAGNAVIATRTAGPIRLADALGRSVSWCDAGSPASLAAAIQTLHADRAALAASRAAAWTVGHDRFNWDVEQHAFLAAVSAAVGRRAPARVSTAA